MRKQAVTRRQFLGSGIAAAGAISIVGALPANARDWEEYAARFDQSISDGLPAGPLRPDDETAWKTVAKNYTTTPCSCDISLSQIVQPEWNAAAFWARWHAHGRDAGRPDSVMTPGKGLPSW
jgi:hypothetical protein